MFDESDCEIIARTYAAVNYQLSWESLPEPIRVEYLALAEMALNTIKARTHKALIAAAEAARK